ncbi:MAG: efflux RND transporter periplasmic adaptor subunit [Ignavibacteriaceae bacterium]|nr:efflux RND transporter periplasmic adaptor subunit [Ignavibacteriaceae bacterium]
MSKIQNKILMIIAVTGIALGLNACKPEDSKAAKVTDKNYTTVRVQKVEYSSYTDYIELVGTVKPIKTAKISSETGGKIKQFYKEKGAYVNQGEIILVLDNDVLKSQLDAAKAEYDFAEINFNKQKAVYEQNVGSEFQYLQAKYNRDARKAAYELINNQYERTFIKAPFSGYIDEKNYEVGEVTGPGVPVVTLVNPGSLKITTGVPEKYLTDVRVGSNVVVTFKELPDVKITGSVSFVAKAISPDSRTFEIEVVIPNTGNGIKPEQSANIKIVRQVYDKVLVVPEEIINQTDLGEVVFVARQSDDVTVADMKTVNIAGRSDNKAAITAGLESGDEVIVVGYQNLVNGEKVKVIK